MLTITPALRKLITPETNLAELTKLAYKVGMQPLIINGAEKIAAGITTIEELMKVAPPLGAE
jgi:general secretion pathway protein E